MAHNSPYQKPKTIVPRVAGAAITQYRIVVKPGATEDQVVIGANIRDTQIDGISLNTAAAAGDPVDVVTAGFCKLKVDGAAAAIAVGDSIMVHDATGYGQKCTTGGAGHVECVGYAENASTADGDIIGIRVHKHTVYFAA